MTPLWVNSFRIDCPKLVQLYHKITMLYQTLSLVLSVEYISYQLVWNTLCN